MTYVEAVLTTHHAAANAGESELSILAPIFRGIGQPETCLSPEIRDAAHAQHQLASLRVVLERDHGYAYEFLEEQVRFAFIVHKAKRLLVLARSGINTNVAVSSTPVHLNKA